MSEEVYVISGDIDGADLRRKQRVNPYHLRCDGTADDAEINEAIQGLSGKRFSIPADAWTRIFGEPPCQ